MTEIACNITHKVPFLFCDILMSSTERPASVDLPTNTFDLGPHLPANNAHYPHSLAQKMYIIQKKICIVFAGREDEIKEFLAELKIRCNYFKDDVDVDRIRDFMNEYPFETRFARSSLFLVHVTGSLKTNNIDFSLFYAPKPLHSVKPDVFDIKPGVWNVLDTDAFGEVYAAGTGTAGYLNLIRQFPTMYTIAPKGSVDYAVQANGILAAQLFTLEKVALYTVRDLWGGGFEVAFFDGNGFQKFEHIAYITNHSQFDDTGDPGLPKPSLVMFYRYVGELLHITAIEITDGHVQDLPDVVKFTSAPHQIVVRQFFVPPLDYDLSIRPPVVDLSFKTNAVAMGYSLVTQANTIYNPAFFNHGQQIFVEYNDGGNIEISIHPGFVQKISAASQAIYPKLLPTMFDPRIIDAATHLRIRFPGFFQLSGESPIKWDKVNKRRIARHEENLAKFEKTKKPFSIETSFFNVIDKAHAGDPQAQASFHHIQNLFRQLARATTPEEKKMIRAALYGLLTNTNKNYLNFLGELSALNYLKKKEPLKLIATERPLFPEKPKSTKIDFHFKHEKTQSETLVEIVNIHINKNNSASDEAIKELLHEKIQGKLDATGIHESQAFTLLPIVWGQWKDLQVVASYYKRTSPSFQNTHIPLCFIPCTDENGLRVDVFDAIDKIFDTFKPPEA
jgi:hypothetical protein